MAGIGPTRRRLQDASGALPVIPRKRGARYRVIPGSSCPIFRRAELTAGHLYARRQRVFPAMDVSNIKPVREARRGGGIRTRNRPLWRRVTWTLSYVPKGNKKAALPGVTPTGGFRPAW